MGNMRHERCNAIALIKMAQHQLLLSGYVKRYDASVCHLNQLMDASKSAKSHVERCRLSEAHDWMSCVMDAGIKAGAANAGSVEGVQQIPIRFANGAIRNFLVSASEPDAHGTTTLVIGQDAFSDDEVEHNMFLCADWIDDPCVLRQVIQGPAGRKAVALSEQSKGMVMRIDVKTHMRTAYYHLIDGKPLA
jgi:hypothetical protein